VRVRGWRVDVLCAAVAGVFGALAAATDLPEGAPPQSTAVSLGLASGLAMGLVRHWPGVVIAVQALFVVASDRLDTPPTPPMVLLLAARLE
jgi:hypothetical protein